MASGAAAHYWLTRALFVLLLVRAGAYDLSFDDLIVLDCDIKIKQKFPSGGESVVGTFECTDIEVFDDSDNPPTNYEWSDSPFSRTDPHDACSAPVHPVVPVNESHIALVPWCGECNYPTKAANLGSSGYVAYITWNEMNCARTSDSQQSDALENDTAIAIRVRRSTGQFLVAYSNSSKYVLDVTVQLWKFGDLLMAFVGVSFGTIVIICFCFCGCFGIRVWLTRERRTTMSNRTISRMTVKRKYRSGGSMNETCSICLEDFNEGEDVRELPCKHVYHQPCVDVWLKNYKDECPNCKTSITASKKKKKGGHKSSEQSPLLADRDDGNDDEATVDYGSTRPVGDPEQDEDAQTDQVRLTAHEPEGSEEEMHRVLSRRSGSTSSSDGSTELLI